MFLCLLKITPPLGATAAEATDNKDDPLLLQIPAPGSARPCGKNQETIQKILKYNDSPLAAKIQKKIRFILSTLPFNILRTLAPVRFLKTLYHRTMSPKTLLPQDEVNFISSLSRPEAEARLKALWDAGWSLSILGESLEPKRPKTTIHFWVKKAEAIKQFREIPTPPPRSLTTATPTKKAPRLRSVSPNVPPDMKPRLKELAKLAKRYRARTTSDSPFAKANRDLTAMAVALRSMGVPTAKIATAAGVSYRAMARRLSK
jgi:hypothetical protein